MKEWGFDSFVDFSGIPGGEDWEHAIHDALRSSSLLLLCATRKALQSRWVFAELMIARYEEIPVVPLVLEDVDLPAVVSGKTQHIDFRQGEDSALHQLHESLEYRLSIASWSPTTSPFPGLRTMEEADAPVFFGRERELEQALESLRRGQSPLTIVGPSGCGKSSFVRAALIPALKRGAIDGSEGWIYLDAFRPGGAPVRNLAEEIRRHSPGDQSIRDLEDSILSDGLLYNLLELRGENEARIVLPVDQLEDLIQPDAGRRAREFARQLVRCIEAPDSPAILLFTLRVSDLSAFMEDPDLEPLVSSNRLTVLSPMSHEALRKVIVEPCRVGRIRLEDDELAEEMIDDAHGVDALPLLAHVLNELWTRMHAAKRRVIRRDDYISSGGVQGALSRHANDALSDLSSSDREAVPKLLVGLMDVDESGTPSVRALRLGALSAAARSAVQRLTEARLLVESTNESGDSTVQFAHEALLRNWDYLRDLRQRETIRLEALRYIRKRAQKWIEGDRRSKDLLDGPQLRAYTRLAGPQAEEYLHEDGDLSEYYSLSLSHTRKKRLQQSAIWATLLLSSGFAVERSVFANRAAEQRESAERGALTARRKLIRGRLEMVQNRVGEVFERAEQDMDLFMSQFADWFRRTEHPPELDDLETLSGSEPGLTTAARHVHGLNRFFLPIVANRSELTSMMVVREPGYEYLVLRLGPDRFMNRLVTERGYETPPIAPAYEILFDRTAWPLTESRPVDRGDSPAPWPGRVLTGPSDTDSAGNPWKGYDVASRPWVAPLLEPGGGDRNWTPPTTFFVTKEPGLTYSAVREHGGVRYILGMDYKLTEISLISTRVDLGDSGKAIVLMEDSETGAPRIVGLPSIPELTEEIVKDVFGVKRELEADGDPSLPPLTDPGVRSRLGELGFLTRPQLDVIDEAWGRRLFTSSSPEIQWADHDGERFWWGMDRLELGGFTLFVIVQAREDDLIAEGLDATGPEVSLEGE